jgi:PAS domain S-box-containing protein
MTKRSTEKTPAHHERYNAIYQNMPSPTFTWQLVDGDFKLIDYNKAAVAFSGNDLPNLLGAKASDLYKDEPELQTNFNLCFQSKKNFATEMTYKIRSTGQLKYVSVNYSFIAPDLVLVQPEEITQRKKTETELTEHNKQLASFIENSPAAIAMLDRDMRYIAVSNKWISDYGLENQQLKGKTHYEVFPEIGQEWKDVHQRCLFGAHEKREEDSFLRSDGHINWMRWEVKPWRDGDNQIGGIIMFTEEITERKKAQEELKNSEKRFHLLADNALVGIYILKSGQFSYVNNAMANYFGYTTTEMIGMTIHQIVHPSDTQKIENYIEKRITGNQDTLSYEFVGITLTKEIKNFEVFGSKILINNVDAFIGTVIDITERKSAEKKIKDDAQKLTNILQHLPFGLSIKNKNDDFVLFNESFNEITGYSLSEIPNIKTWFQNSYPDSAYRNTVTAEWSAKVASAMQANRKFEPMLSVVKCKDGTIKNLKQFYGKIGEETITLYQDVTE